MTQSERKGVIEMLSSRPNRAVPVWSLALVVPLSLVQVYLYKGSVWWDPPWVELATALGASLLFALFWIASIQASRRRSVPLLSGVALFWVVWSAGVALRLASPALGFFALALSLYWLLVLPWLVAATRRPHADPGIEWFEGEPAAIAGLRAELEGVEQPITLRVAHLSHDGAFVLSDRPLERQQIERLGRARLRVAIDSRSAWCDGEPVSLLWRSGRVRGFGLQFVGMRADDDKSLGDVLQYLRGLGYVA